MRRTAKWFWLQAIRAIRGSCSPVGVASWCLYLAGVYASLAYLDGGWAAAGVLGTKAASWTIYAIAVIRA